jgi:hypothetical protein
MKAVFCAPTSFFALACLRHAVRLVWSAAAASALAPPPSGGAEGAAAEGGAEGAAAEGGAEGAAAEGGAAAVGGAAAYDGLMASNCAPASGHRHIDNATVATERRILNLLGKGMVPVIISRRIAPGRRRSDERRMKLA